MSPLRRQNPREEIGALAAHAGICAGGEEKSSCYRDPWQVLAGGIEPDFHPSARPINNASCAYRGIATTDYD
jgi:hypothetical protein